MEAHKKFLGEAAGTRNLGSGLQPWLRPLLHHPETPYRLRPLSGTQLPLVGTLREPSGKSQSGASSKGLAPALARPRGHPDPLLPPLLPGQSSLEEVGNQEGGLRPLWALRPADAQDLIWGGQLQGGGDGQSQLEFEVCKLVLEVFI